MIDNVTVRNITLKNNDDESDLKAYPSIKLLDSWNLFILSSHRQFPQETALKFSTKFTFYDCYKIAKTLRDLESSRVSTILL